QFHHALFVQSLILSYILSYNTKQARVLSEKFLEKCQLFDTLPKLFGKTKLLPDHRVAGVARKVGRRRDVSKGE
ncbi:hypothetical protein HKBW3C_02875, partial [Candidatus Hakubella thermalkaliphila]